MKNLRVEAPPSRRAWLRDCTALVAAACLAAAMPAGAQGHPGAKILVVGDSLSAEYGIARGSGWVALLGARLQQQRPDYTVVNASISGDTTAGGRSRLPSLLMQVRPGIVILELGANDALRGLPLKTTRDNLAAMTQAARAAGARVVIVGMQLPPNYGRHYGEEFAAVYIDVARDEKASLVPFMFHGVADVPQAESMFQADRLHPLAIAHPIILDNIWPVLLPLLKR